MVLPSILSWLPTLTEYQQQTLVLLSMKVNRFLCLMAFLCSGGFIHAQSKANSNTAGLTLELTDKTTFQFGGAVWINYANQDWISTDIGRKRGLRFDNIRLSMDGTHGDHLLFSAQYRIYGYTRAVHHAWIGNKPNEKNQIEMGITQVPFGLLTFATHSFWFGLGYNHGMEDDYDAGIKWHWQGECLDIYLAGFYSEEYGDATNLKRYSVVLVRVDEQQNEEFAQGSVRLAYFIGRNTAYQTEFGASRQVGGIDNVGVDKNGYRWKAAFHYSGRYNSWNPEIQIARYEYHPHNPDTEDNRLVLLGNLTSKRLVAAKGTLINVNLRHLWDVNYKDLCLL